jgi:23S rRNA (adenine2503-C2)-methyltransferase
MSMELLAPSRNLLGLSRSELEQLLVSLGQPRYRGAQLYHGLYVRRARDFSALTDLDKKCREVLSSHHAVAYPEIRGEFISRDGAIRYLLQLEDSNSIETVYLPEKDRATLCLSSQVGCALDCRFCFTALLGVKRNLTAGDMIGQVLGVAAARQIPRRARLNLVFMGMGEPLLNLAQVMKAVKILADPKGVGIPLRRITLSTAGIVPGIRDLAREPLRPKLAVSLNASHDEQRTALMPLNRKYPLGELLRVCRAYPLRARERLTFEYVLLEGVNDSAADARRVAELLRGMHAKVNLIPYNPGPELPYRPSPFERVMAFQRVLTGQRIPAFIRISRGQDVCAACGQLSLVGIGERTLRAPSA